MSDLGALLRKAREERSLSLDDIQELTKIRKRYLEAIETGDYRVLPGTFYVRAFVRNYSEAVGLEPEEVLRLYQHEVPASLAEQSPDPIPARKPRRMKSQTSERLGKIGFNLLMWCFLFLIVGVIWYYASKDGSKSPEVIDDTPITDKSDIPAATETVKPTLTPQPTETVAPPTEMPTTITLKSKTGNVETFQVGPPGKTHTLEVKIEGGDSWVEVKAGGVNGEKLYFATAENGFVQTFEMSGLIYVNVGRSDFAELHVDGIIVPDSDKANSTKLLLEPMQDEVQSDSKGE